MDGRWSEGERREVASICAHGDLVSSTQPVARAACVPASGMSRKRLRVVGRRRTGEPRGRSGRLGAADLDRARDGGAVAHLGDGHIEERSGAGEAVLGSGVEVGADTDDGDGRGGVSAKDGTDATLRGRQRDGDVQQQGRVEGIEPVSRYNTGLSCGAGRSRFLPTAPRIEIRFLQAVLIRTTDSVEVGAGAVQMPVIFSTRMVSGIRAGEPGRMADITRTVMRYLTAAFGLDQEQSSLRNSSTSSPISGSYTTAHATMPRPRTSASGTRSSCMQR